MEAEEPSLYLPREKLAVQYAIRLAANPSNPTFKVTFPPHISQDIIDLYDNKPNQEAIKSFGLRIAPLLTSANKEQIEIHHGAYENRKSNPHLLKQNFHDLQSYYSDHEHIYTDGSKDKEKVGCAAAKYDDCKTMCIPDGSSVFTAEAKAIDLALDFVNNCTYTDKFVIFSDSLSVLQVKSYILKELTNTTFIVKAL